ncbi:MAG: hypothetical protein QOI60_624 [Actinomycetota bacterium]|jgi:hypothetical protein|nr:hypothetical protein [Actinomycetota bacterium]
MIAVAPAQSHQRLRAVELRARAESATVERARPWLAPGWNLIPVLKTKEISPSSGLNTLLERLFAQDSFVFDGA